MGGWIEVALLVALVWCVQNVLLPRFGVPT